MKEKLNEDQRRWIKDAKRVVDAYNYPNASNLAEIQENIIDIISDLMHLARYENLDVQQILATCQNHFEVETHPELEY